ncbi:MAG: glycosyltransferase family 2 protein [Solirubrobacteraceae bacterium]
MSPPTIVILTARDEADRLGATLDALARAFPAAPVVVGDDGSTDGTAAVARGRGAMVVGGLRPQGKGGTATRAARRALELGGPGTVYVLCDGDLGETALELVALERAVRGDAADLAVAAFATRPGGGFGLALGFAGWAIRKRGGPTLRAPISGQRALTAEALRRVLPFAPRFGMEIGMTVDAARAGLRIREIELGLSHRATVRDWRGFLHRARQLADFVAVYRSRA